MEHWVELMVLHFYQLEVPRESSQGEMEGIEAIAYNNYMMDLVIINPMWHMRIRMLWERGHGTGNVT